jgi:hypothetical protein
VKRVVIAIALAALAACGDNNPTLASDASGMDGGSGSGSGSGQGTLTAYVIDLVTNHTTATELPRPYAEFASLPDPDGDSNNTAAYQSLFP